LTRAIIFISGQLDPSAADRCMDHVKERGWEFGGLERDWDEAVRLAKAGEVDVILVDTEAGLDPNRKPRVEVVANQPATRYETRTRLIRRRGGAR
jgi:hypothetical protein